MRRLILAAVTATVLTFLAFALAAVEGGSATTNTALLPDLRTVVPQHVQLVSHQQREILRFSNGIANTGPGPWALRPDPPIEDATDTTTAIQELRDSNAFYKCGEQPRADDPCYTIVEEFPTSIFEFHPQHNHWHIGDVALFEVRRGSPTGRVVGGISIKTTFCLIDWYKLDGNSNSAERVFFDCETSYQGIQSGWVDQYHQSLDGQSLDLTGIPSRNDYYLVSTANPEGIFREATTTNNTAWVRFRLYEQGNGRAVEVTGHSPCTMGTGLCGENAPNR